MAWGTSLSYMTPEALSRCIYMEPNTIGCTLYLCAASVDRVSRSGTAGVLSAPLIVRARLEEQRRVRVIHAEAHVDYHVVREEVESCRRAPERRHGDKVKCGIEILRSSENLSWKGAARQAL